MAVNDQTLVMSCEKQVFIENCNDIDDFTINTNDWDLNEVQLSFSQLQASNFLKTINDQDSKKYPDDSTVVGFQPAATSFQISHSTNLKGISLYMSKNGDYFAEELRILIYNSSWVYNHHEPPSPSNAPIYYEDFEVTPSGSIDIEPQWKNFEFSSPVYLDIDDTVNNTFFVQLRQLGGNLNWFYQVSESKTTSLYWSGYSWNAITDSQTSSNVDLTLKVNLMDYSFFPSEAQMKVNGSLVSDTADLGIGELTLIGPYTGANVYFDISSESGRINYSVNYLSKLQTETNITPASTDNGESIEWTLEFEATFLPDSFNNEIKVTIGEEWTSTKVYLNSVEYSDATVDYTNDQVLIHNVIVNGIWKVVSTEENQGSDPEPTPVPEPPHHWWWRFWFFIWRLFFRR